MEVRKRHVLAFIAIALLASALCSCAMSEQGRYTVTATAGPHFVTYYGEH